MEGLKLIAQSTFDKHQKFRPSAATGLTGEGAYRYNVIEIGAFGGSSSSSSTAAKRQSVGSVQSSASGSRQGNGSASAKISLNEWMVFEDDLGSFMKKRPIDLGPTTTSSGSGFGGELEKQANKNAAAASTTTASTAPSKTPSMPSSRMTTNTLTTATTAPASTPTNTNTATDQRPRKPREEIEAVASLKLVCIPRADVDNPTNPHDANPNTLAIARETFLRLYVDHMDADHCALYYVAREYDGYHEFTDTPKGVVTKFLGTSDYALIWTFNRRTLETRGLFLDRCQRWRSSDSGAAAAAAMTRPATSSGTTPSKQNPDGGGGGGGPMTPVNNKHHFAASEAGNSPATPSKRWARKQTGSVGASDTWSGFRETLNTYRRYIFAPQVLSFVCCVQMLRSFDDQTNEEDLPRLKEVEAGIAVAQAEVVGGGGASASGGVVGLGLGLSRGGGLLPTTQGSSFALVSEQNPFAPSTPPPGDDEKLVTPTKDQLAALARERLAAQSLAISRVDSSLADKLRHLTIARKILDVIARENETLTVDVVAPSFLDRYHWAMEGMSEAIPALERHISSLEEYLRYLKGRSERLSGLVRSHLTTVLAAAVAAATPPISQTQSSDALSLRCNPGADSSRSDLDSVVTGDHQQQQQQQQLLLHRANAAAKLSRGGPVAHRVVSGGGGSSGGGSGGALPSVAAVFASRLGGEGLGGRHDVGRGDGGGSEVGRAVELQPRQQRAAGRRGFYTGYLVSGNYSHRLA